MGLHKWALESITTNKASGGDGIPEELFQILNAVFFLCLFLLFVLGLVCCLFCLPFIQPHMVSRLFIPRLRVRSELLGREH